MITDKWNSYLSEVLPDNVSAIQLQETRRAFYAGAAACFHTIQSFLGDGLDHTEAEVDAVESLVIEMRDYALSIGTFEEGKDRRPT